eukprot:2018438-Rhodomonas_salina.1
MQPLTASDAACAAMYRDNVTATLGNVTSTLGNVTSDSADFGPALLRILYRHTLAQYRTSRRECVGG